MNILVVDDAINNVISAEEDLNTDGDTAIGDTSFDRGLTSLEHGPKEGGTWDVVLIDLMMPPGLESKLSDPKVFAGQEMPVGIFLALLAAKKGAKLVAVFTDSSHHSHPASACFDLFNPRGESKPEPLMVNGAKVFFCNNRQWVQDRRVGVMQFPSRTKNWKAVLEYMLQHA